MMTIVVAIYWISLICSVLSAYMLAEKPSDAWLNLFYCLLGVTLISSIVIALAYADKMC